MAIDNAEKRRSAASVGPVFTVVGVTPNSSKDQEWRQQAAWGYSGILAGGIPIKDMLSFILYIDQRRSMDRYIEQKRAMVRYLDQARSIDTEL